MRGEHAPIQYTELPRDGRMRRKLRFRRSHQVRSSAPEGSRTVIGPLIRTGKRRPSQRDARLKDISFEFCVGAEAVGSHGGVQAPRNLVQRPVGTPCRGGDPGKLALGLSVDVAAFIAKIVLWLRPGMHE